MARRCRIAWTTHELRLPDLLDRLPERKREIVACLAEAFREAGEELYLVGGIVRDLLREQPSTDLDFATSAAPERTKVIGAVAQPTASYAVGEAYGTIGFAFEYPSDATIVVEITTYRSEVYPTEDRHPTVDAWRLTHRRPVAARLHDQRDGP